MSKPDGVESATAQGLLRAYYTRAILQKGVDALFVVDISEEKDQPHMLVNPVLEPYGDKIKGEEGCLSVPDIYDSVERFEYVKVSAQDVRGEPLQFTADGMLSICIQHECDHLEGKLFVDYLSSLKRGRISKALRERAK